MGDLHTRYEGGNLVYWDTHRKRIVDAVAIFGAVGLSSAPRAGVALYAGSPPSSSSFANNLGALRTAGLVEYPAGGTVALTEAGRELVSPSITLAPPPSLADLHERWLGLITPARARILRVLIEAYPQSVDRSGLAIEVGATPTSSSFANNLGHLRNTLGLVEYPGDGFVRAAAILFPEGVPVG